MVYPRINITQLQKILSSDVQIEDFNINKSYPTNIIILKNNELYYSLTTTTQGEFKEDEWVKILSITDLDKESEEIIKLLNIHVANKKNPHNVNKFQLGLGNVDNTSDLNKPISNATQLALDAKADKSNTYTKDETINFLNQKLDIDIASETYETITNVNSHINDKNNPHNVTKAQLGLENVDNTTDINKPISNATQIALDAKADKSNTYTKDETDGSIKIISDKIDESIRTVSDKIDINNSEIEKLNLSVNSLQTNKADTSDLNSHINNNDNPHNVTKTQLGLENVDNTTDINKPISNATQLALDTKADKSNTYTKDEVGEFLNQKLDIDAASETYETITNVNSHINNNDNPHNVTKTQLGLSDVDNTSDLNKPISNATQIALDAKADKSDIYTKDEVDESIRTVSDEVDESIRTVSDKIDGTITNINLHINDKNNPHNVTKTQLGLENVDNTSDLNKPISNATQIALDAKADKSNTYTKDEVDGKISSVYRFKGSIKSENDLPLSNQMMGDTYNVEDTGANYAWTGSYWDKLSETVDLSSYLTKDIASETYETITNVNSHINNKNNPHNVTKAQLGLSNVDNTNDLNKPISNATQLALNAKQDIATAINYNNITNCITEIPQDIKLEYSGNTITLKSGSQTYVPNGSGVFANNLYTQDKSVSFATGLNGSFIIFAGQSANSDIFGQLESCFYSGSPAPTFSTNVVVWYDTSANIIKFSSNGGSTWSSVNYSFPLAKVTLSNGEITSIDQVFNGFGYIGLTTFALPGVKGLIPNGRNVDGSLKNTSFINEQVVTVTPSNGEYSLRLAHNYLVVGVFPYDPITNRNYNVTIAQGNERNQVNAGRIIISNGRITSFKPKPVFHAVDYSDFENTVEKLNSSITSTKTELNSSISSVDSSAVHKTGNETIQGTKTFLNNTLWKTDSIEIGVAPETNKYATWNSVYDKNNKMISFIETAYLTNGTLSLVVGERTYINGNPVTNSLTFRTDENGNRTALLSHHPLGSSNDTSIATTQWTKTLFLPFTGGTLTGNITIQKETPQISLKSTTMDITSSGWATGRNTVAWCMDKNGYESGGVYNTTDSGGTSRTYMYTMSRKTGSQVQAMLSAVVSSNGTAYATAPNPPTSANGTEIVTASWANSKFRNVVAEQKATSANNYKWYRKYSDGWVEQGGMQNIGNSNRTVLFPIAMANKDAYDLQLTVIDKYRYACVANTSEKTTTSIVVTTGDDSSSNNDGTINWYVCGYAA